MDGPRRALGHRRLGRPGMLAEVYRQKLKAPFYVEYEYHWDDILPEVARCVKFFDRGGTAELLPGSQARHRE